MTVGIIHNILCHVDPDSASGVLTLDSWSREYLTYNTAFTNGEATVTRGDATGVYKRGYVVAIKYLAGSEPAGTQTRTTILTNAKNAIEAAYPGETTTYTLAA